MVAIVSTAYSTNTYYKAAASAQAAGAGSATSTAASATTEQAAATVTLSDEALAALAATDFATIIAETRTRLAALLKEAAEVGVNSTPSFVVNGRLVAGADYALLKRIIEEILGKKEK